MAEAKRIHILISFNIIYWLLLLCVLEKANFENPV